MKKLYDADAYATEFDGIVESCNSVEYKGKTAYEVVLDQTLFFPEEGGQTPDKGRIQGIAVVDVQIKQGMVIHTLERPVEVGSRVHGIIDWNHRFSNMQQHTGEHIFSGLVHQRFGYDNVGFHLSDQVVTMDFNGMISEEEAAMIEYAANKAIISNLEIEVSYPSKEELKQLAYRSKIEIDGQVRIVTIPGVDVCACCAPHVRRTGEVGMVKIVGMQNYKGGVRISILCGFRALMDYRQKTEILSSLSAELSANQDTIEDTVLKLKDSIQSLKQELVAARQQVMKAKLEGVPKDQEDVWLFEQGVDAQVMREAVNQLVEEHTGVCGIFTETEDGYRFIMGSKEKNVRPMMDRLKEKCNAKGGGSAVMVQGSVQASKDEILSVVTDVVVSE